MMRLLIVDDSRLRRDLLACALMPGRPVTDVVTVADLPAALGALAAPGPWIVLLTMELPGSAEALAALAREPAVRVVALGVPEEEEQVIAYAEAGAAAVLLRTESLDDLTALIASVARGESRCTPRMTAALLRHVAAQAAERQARAIPANLTNREREILQLLDEGLSNMQIARRLSIELRTVKNHVHHILEKFQVHRRAEAAGLYRAARRPPVDAGR